MINQRTFFHIAKYTTGKHWKRGQPLVPQDDAVDRRNYANVLIKLYGYDPATLTSFHRFVDQAAKNMKFNVTKKFNLTTKAFTVTLANTPHYFNENKMQYHLKEHGRLIQVESLPTETADIFLQYIRKNIPAGISVQMELKKWQDFVSPQGTGEAT
ncbi:probable 28S ribosomal protein S10, mitochondrial [Xenia sp. Carnegie-2017]|uniref:probable 28S ribosomal protein S10, mitochondrial n=1 Tax=Xenia sp. Carnegie-2017 TaxID=2897299 RepID=UPI001F038CF0|nr:probable 28S ribosomal protein S10, mitochondrial [Xenia sp. Carnegie-2017]